jgi:flagellar basal-body rod protein FlgG
MDRSIFVALSGAIAQEKRLEAASYNIANADTTGYKKQNDIFSAVFTDVLKAYPVSEGLQVDMTQGSVKNTGNPLDLAIMGNGFFVVKTPQGERFTRQGDFTVNSEGVLSTKEGYPVVGEGGDIKIVGQDVVVTESGGVSTEEMTETLLSLVSFDETTKFVKQGQYFSVVKGSVNRSPELGEIRIEQGQLEASNVNAAKEMINLIEIMRRYDNQTKMIQTLDDITKKTINDIAAF